MLLPLVRGKKRIGLLKVAPRVQGKIMETDTGVRFLIIEQKGRDVWTGRARSIDEAIKSNEAGVGVDRTLHQASVKYGVTLVMVVIEEQRRVFMVPVCDFSNTEIVRTQANWRGRATSILPYTHYKIKYVGPHLQKRKRTARTTA